MEDEEGVDSCLELGGGLDPLPLPLVFLAIF
jgi:hypothetical protein